MKKLISIALVLALVFSLAPAALADGTLCPACNNAMTHTAAKDATCTEAGNAEYYYCATCDQYYASDATTKLAKDDTVDAAKGHTITKVDAKDPTATEAGNYEYYLCSVCNKTFKDADGTTEYTDTSYIRPATGDGSSTTPAPTTKTGTIVNCNYGVNVRAKATSSSKSLGTAKKGSTWTILGTSGSWTKIQYGTTEAYVFSKYISTGATGTDVAASGTLKIVNCSSFVTVRAEATTASTKLGTAKKNATFTLLAKNGNWYKIQYTDSQTGYVYKTYGKIVTTPSETAYNAYGYVTGKTVWIRTGAGTSYPTMDLAKANEVYRITAKCGSWYKVEADGTEGYISKSYVKVVTTNVSKTATVVNCKVSVNVRAGTSTSSKKLGTADLGDSFTYLKTSGSYVMVDYDGEVGYIYKSYIKIG